MTTSDDPEEGMPGADGPAVLIVEDDRINALVTERLLRRHGVRADVAATGGDALARLAAGDYRLVLMDLHLPDMSGIDAVRTIRDPASAVHDHRVAVVALSATDDPAEQEACRQAGMDAVLEKPIVEARFAAILARFVRGAAGSPPAQDTSGNEESAFDAGELERRLGSPRLARTVAESFHGVMDARLADIHAALESNNARDIRAAAHALSSPAANTGVRALRELLKAVERAAAAGDAVRARELAAGLDATAARARAAIESYLNS